MTKALSSAGLSGASSSVGSWPYAFIVSRNASMGPIIWSWPSVTTWNWMRISPTSLVAVMSALKTDSPW